MTTTRDKRASAVHVLIPWGRITPTPDVSAETVNDRRHIAGLYRHGAANADASLTVVWDNGGYVTAPITVIWDNGGPAHASLTVIWDNGGPAHASLTLIWDNGGPVQKPITLVWDNGGTLNADPFVLEWSNGGALSAELLVMVWANLPSPLRIEYALTGQLSGVVRPTFRFEKRTRAGVFVEDISSIFIGGSIEHNENRAVKRTATFLVNPDLDPSIDLDPLTDHVMPFMRLLVDGQVNEDIPLGLFTLSVPEEAEYFAYDEHQIKGSDLSDHLVQDYIATPYEVAAGQNPISGTNGVRDLLDAAGVNHHIPDTSAVLTAPLPIAIGAPKLEAVNLLLKAASMYNLSFDSHGIAHSRVQQDMSARAPDVTYSDEHWVLDPIKKRREVSRFANRVIVVSTDPQNIFAVTVENNDPASTISIPNLGVTRTKKIEVTTLPDAAAAEEYGKRYLEREAGLYEAREIALFPDPRRQFNEVVALEVKGVTENWFVQSWRLDLKEGKPMRMALGKVNRVTSEVA